MSKADEVKRGSELARTPAQSLSPVQRQELFYFEVDSRKAPCPSCGASVSVIDAADDGYRIGRGEERCACPRCGARLVQVVPMRTFGAAWSWTVVDERRSKRGRRLSESELLAAELKSKHDDGRCTPSTCVICRGAKP